MDEKDEWTDRGAEYPASASPREPRRRWQMLLLILLGGGMVVFAAYKSAALIHQNREDARFAPLDWIDLNERQGPSEDGQASGVPSDSSLRVGIAPVISPEKSIQFYHDFVNYIAAALDRSPVLLQRETYAAVNDLVRSRRCDLALVCTYPFVRGEREFGMEALVVPQIDGVTTYHSLILVPQSSEANSLLDLREKRFASADILSNSGWLFPAIWLKDHGEDANTFFQEHVITGSHDRSVVAVASAYVDGAAVDSLVYDQMVYEDPSIAERTRTVLKSPPFGMPPIVVPPGIDPDLKQQLRSILLGMHTDAKGRKILASLKIDRFVVPRDDLYDSVREASKVWEARE